MVWLSRLAAVHRLTKKELVTAVVLFVVEMELLSILRSFSAETRQYVGPKRDRARQAPHTQTRARTHTHNSTSSNKTVRCDSLRVCAGERTRKKDVHKCTPPTRTHTRAESRFLLLFTLFSTVCRMPCHLIPRQPNVAYIRAGDLKKP